SCSRGNDYDLLVECFMDNSNQLAKERVLTRKSRPGREGESFASSGSDRAAESRKDVTQRASRQNWAAGRSSPKPGRNATPGAVALGVGCQLLVGKFRNQKTSSPSRLRTYNPPVNSRLLYH